MAMAMAMATGDGSGSGSDASNVPLVVSHVDPGDAAPGTRARSLSAPVTINTTAPSISTTLPSGIMLEHVAQTSGGPPLAVLRVGSLDVGVGATVRVVGTRPFVVIAATTITVAGTLQARTEPSQVAVPRTRPIWGAVSRGRTTAVRERRGLAELARRHLWQRRPTDRIRVRGRCSGQRWGQWCRRRWRRDAGPTKSADTGYANGGGGGGAVGRIVVRSHIAASQFGTSSPMATALMY